MPHWTRAGGLLFVAALNTACTADTPNLSEVDVASQSPAVQRWLGSASDPVTSISTTRAQAAPVADMITGLEQRLESQPDDVKGWMLLAQSYAFLGDMSRAQEAGEKAVALGVNNDEMLARIHDAHVQRSR